MAYALVFDLETSGLPRYRNVSPFKTQYYDSSRMIEIGYVIISPNGIVLKEYKHLVRYEKIVINIENSFIHGITNEMVIEDGVDIQDVFDELKDDMKKVDVIVAHNIDFDYNILLSEIYRKYSKNKELLGLIYSKQLYCTMKQGQKVMKMKKYPKLIELNKYFFKNDWVQTHRAFDDVTICMKCYIELKRLEDPNAFSPL